MDIQQGFVNANGLSFHYASTGSPDKPLMLFLHGFPEFWYEWKDFLPAFADDYYCVAPDQRGYNLTEKPTEIDAYRAKHLIEDVVQLAEDFSPGKKFTLVAHDWGAAVAWGFALKHANKLEQLIILNGVHPAAMQRELASNPAQAKASEYITDMQKGGVAEAYSENNFSGFWNIIGLALAHEEGKLSEQDKQKYLEAYAQPGAAHAMINWYRAMKIKAPAKDSTSSNEQQAFDPSSLVVKVPTLVLWGLQDTALLPGCIDGLDTFVTNLTMETREDCGHWIVHEQPQWCIERIKNWLK